MIVTSLFYLFASLCIGSGAMVVLVRNSVHAVLFLILAFFNAAGLMLLLGAEFLAFILIIVYVGAIAVLFLFVVMMLDIDLQEQQARRVASYLPVGLLVGGVLLAEIIVASQSDVFATLAAPVAASGLSNTESLGRVLYTQYFYAFQLGGAILLVAMVGAIVLTLRPLTSTKRQNIVAQTTRGKGVVLVNPAPGQGLRSQPDVAENTAPAGASTKQKP